MFYSSKDPEAYVQPNILTSKMSIELTPSLLYNGDSVLAHAEASDLLLALKGSQNLAKLVLIDPPYNRHTKFHHYDDNMCSKKWSSSVKENCSALRDLLTPDGSLWMHIDDAEMPRARIMLDAVFGSSNPGFINQLYKGFNRKENKYVAPIKNNSPTQLAGQVISGPDSSGIKAYYTTVTMQTDATTD